MKNEKEKMIHVGPDYALQGDRLCITLFKRRVTEKGKVQWDPLGYYPDFPYALKRMVDMEIGPLNVIENIVAAIDALREHIDSLPLKSIRDR